MRAELIKRAEAMLKSRHIESPFDVSHDELPSLLASFAADVLAEREAEVVSLPKYQMESISEGLRISMNYFHSKNKATALDRILCRNADYIAEAMDGTKQENNETSKND